MRVAIYSDIHDNFYNLRLALLEMKERQIGEALCLGDFIHPGIIKEIISSKIKTFAIWGNNDGEKVAITKAALSSDGIFQIGETTFAHHEKDGRKVFLTHHPDFAPSLARSGDFDAVFYGHDHEVFYEKLSNGCILANPGEISSHKTGRATFLIWDTAENTVEVVELHSPINVNIATR